MNKGFEIVNGKVIVRNQYYQKSERECVNNIEERLITENNIEEIEELIKKKQIDIKYDKKSMNLSYIHLVSVFLWTISAILNISSGNSFAAAMNLLCAGCWSGTACLSIMPNLKKIKKWKMQVSMLEKNLIDEKDKLKELQKDNSNNAKCIAAGEKNLSTSTKIQILKNRLDDIELYVNHKHKIIRLYKKGLLEGELFEGCASRDTINFIIELAKNDVGKENIIENNKTKVKTHDINN